MVFSSNNACLRLLAWSHRRLRGSHVLLPLGSTEDRPRGPMQLDTLLALSVSCLAARRCGALVAWPLGYGWSPMHRRWAGPGPGCLARLIRETVTGLLRSGAATVTVVDGHLGHAAVARAAAAAAGAGYVNIWLLLGELGVKTWEEQLRLEEELASILESELPLSHPLLARAAERVASLCSVATSPAESPA